MKKSQRLRATVEDITFETTFEKLPPQFSHLAKMLEMEDVGYSVHECVVTSGGAILLIQLEYVGPKPKTKQKRKIFGYDEEEVMAKQYK